MKKYLNIILLAVLLTAGSCTKGYGDYDMSEPGSFYNGSEPQTVTAIVTIKQDAEGKTFLQVSENIKVYPDGGYEFSGLQRAMCSLYIYAHEGDIYYGQIDWLEPLEMGSFGTGSIKGGAGDGLNIIQDWMTGAEDGYLVIHYSTWWSEHPVHHDFYLSSGSDPDDPYCLELRQDSHGDAHDYLDEGIICFDINSLPDTGDEYRTITLKWNDTDGAARTATFDFKTRK